jgi:hypothetical protein
MASTPAYRALAIGALLLAFTTPALSADTDAVLAFARANENKFKNEIKETRGITVGSKVNLQAPWSAIELTGLGLSYDPDSGQVMTNSMIAILPTLMFSRTCVNKGSYVGQNAYGVKMQVTRQTCEAFFADTDFESRPSLNGISIKMSSSQYRTIKESGVTADFDLVVGPPNSIEVVASAPSLSEPRIDFPFETDGKLWNVRGRIEEIRWIIPGAAQPVKIWSRTQ